MSARDWQTLRIAGYVSGPAPQAATRPVWFIRALQGFAAWIASFFLIGFVLMLLDFRDHQPALLLVGAGLLVAAVVLLRTGHSNDFAVQLALAASLAGQLLIASVSFDMADGNIAPAAIVVIGVAAVVVVAMDHFLQRFLACFVACVALGLLCFDLSAAGLALPLVGAACTALWLTETRWAAHRRLLEPLALATAFAALCMALVFGGTGLWERLGLDDNLVPRWVEAGVMLALLLVVIVRIQQELGAADAGRRGIWLAVLMIAAALLPVILPGSGTALLVGALALRSQRVTLAALSVVLLLGLFARHYYLLELTLLTKSLLLIAGGVLLVVLQQLLSLLVAGERSPLWSRLTRPDRRQWLAALAVVIAMLVVLQDAWRNEQVLDQGSVVLLELAPVDPRSLMQGDYMRLRFAIEQRVLDSFTDEPPPRGHVLVKRDDNGIGRFIGIDNGAPLAVDVVRIPFRYSPRGLALLTNAWFFQEGDAGLYENARYSEFRIGNDGRVLLNAMRDEQLVLLGRPRGDR